VVVVVVVVVVVAVQACIACLGWCIAIGQSVALIWDR
jgi:hypothetical protein